MSVRSSIVAALETRMKTIKVSSGYATDFGNFVATWKSIPAQFESKLLNIRDTADDFSTEFLNGPFNYQTHFLTVEIDLIASDVGATVETYLRSGISDVYKAMGSGAGDTLGVSGVIMTDPISDLFEVSQEERRAAGARITLKIQYRTKKWEN
jgi:hypothetical protein